MHTLSPRKAIAAFATAMAFLAFMATPASADPPYTFGFDSGNFFVPSLGAAPDIDFNIGEEPEEDPCGLYDPNNPTSIEVDITGSGATTIQPGLIGRSTFEDTSTSTWYQINLSISDPNVTGADNTGQITGSSITQNAWIEVDVYEVDPPDCAKDDLACSLLIVFDANFSSPLTGTYTGTIPPTVVTTITNLGGTGLVVVNGACDAGLAGSFDGTSATLSGGSLSFIP